MSQLTPTVTTQDHRRGPLSADSVLVEYGDFECPYCKEACLEIKAVEKALGDRLCFVYRHFPLRQVHPLAEQAAEFAEAAATIGRFWEMHDLLYQHQGALTDADLGAYAHQLGFDAKLICGLTGLTDLRSNWSN